MDVTSKSSVKDISVVTLIRTDTTLDHSQKAEKVCPPVHWARSHRSAKSWHCCLPWLRSISQLTPGAGRQWHRLGAGATLRHGVVRAAAGRACGRGRRAATPTPSAPTSPSSRWAEAHIKIARMTLTIKLDGNWSSFQLANSAPPLSVTDSAIAPSARMPAGTLGPQ